MRWPGYYCRRFHVDDARSKPNCLTVRAARCDPVRQPIRSLLILEHVGPVGWYLHLFEGKHIPMHQPLGYWISEVVALTQRMPALEPLIQRLKAEALLCRDRLDLPGADSQCEGSLHEPNRPY
eukprot:7384473-Prymnesium_polylepis.1